MVLTSTRSSFGTSPSFPVGLLAVLGHLHSMDAELVGDCVRRWGAAEILSFRVWSANGAAAEPECPWLAFSPRTPTHRLHTRRRSGGDL